MKKFFLYASFVCLGFSSCSKEFLVPEGELPEWLGESIYEELKNPKSLEGTFSTYLQLIDDLGYQEVLSKTGSKTIFPANDEAFEDFFRNGNNRFGKSKYEDLTKSEKAQLLYSSMLDNAVLVGSLSTQQNAVGEMTQGMIVKHPTNISLLQSVNSVSSLYLPENNPYFARWKKNPCYVNLLFDDTKAPMVHFSGEYMLNNNMTVVGDHSDFKILTGNKYEDGATYIFDRKVIKPDVTCQNGYIHQLNAVLVNPGNMAQMLREGHDTHLVSRMLDYFAVPVEMGAVFDSEYQQYAKEFGNTDSVFAVRYLSKNSQKKAFNQPVRGTVVSNDCLLDFDPGWNYFAPTATADNQSEIAAILAPTDSVIKAYFAGDGAYIVKNLGAKSKLHDIEGNIEEHLDSIYNSDPTVFTSMLNNIMKPYLSKTVPSKFGTVQNDAFEFLKVTENDIIQKKDKNYDVQIANNGVIYKMQKFFAPELYNSVLGPASVYTDMRIMGKMLNDKQTTPGTPSTLGCDMYYYLLSMNARYALFVPTDNDSFFYIDPASANDPKLKVLKFYKDNSGLSSYGILVQRYDYDPAAKSMTIDPNVGPVAIEKGYFNSQLSDMLNYHTVVLKNANGLTGNHYYKTKHGGAIYVADGYGSIGSKIEGGAQLSGAAAKSEVTQTFHEKSEDAHITNGTVYRLNMPIQPTIKNVYTVLKENSKYQKFLAFCDGFNNEEILTFADILSDKDKASQKASKMKNWVVFGENNRMNMLSTYNYTIYVPENMDEAYNNGLPSWADVDKYYKEFGEKDDDDPGKIAAKKTVKEMLTKMRNFVLYHVQNNSIFADETLVSEENQTFYTNELGIAKTLSLSQNGSVVEVNDEVEKGRAEKPYIVDSNIFARDIMTQPASGYDTNNTAFSYNKLVASSFVVIHSINKPLCYNSNYGF